jgi:hypothetical protein
MKIQVNIMAVVISVVIGILAAATYLTLQKRAGWKGYF